MATRRDDLEHGTNAAYGGLCLQGVPGAPARQDGREPWLTCDATGGQRVRHRSTELSLAATLLRVAC
jgi:hypothetical protein